MFIDGGSIFLSPMVPPGVLGRGPGSRVPPARADPTDLSLSLRQLSIVDLPLSMARGTLMFFDVCAPYDSGVSTGVAVCFD